MKKQLKSMTIHLFKNSILFLLGAVGYGITEILWRGHTHWTMLLAGGICFTFYYKLCEDEKNMPFLIKCFIGAILITCIELIFGTVINIGLGWNVWDYSHIPMNFYGQICLPFFILWFLLCIPLTFLCEVLKKRASV